tara:strand:+ start:467 stop:649 length:183 start_codon:yes stop_codon:yes gene_type:complete
MQVGDYIRVKRTIQSPIGGIVISIENKGADHRGSLNLCEVLLNGGGVKWWWTYELEVICK